MVSTIARVTLCCLVSVMFLAACTTSTSDSANDTGQQQQPPVTAEPAGHNADDIAFATNMIPHHQQAVDLSALVPERSPNPDLQTLASNIATAQEPEIQTMKVLLVQWNENPDLDTGSGHGVHGAMQGMVDEATISRLTSLEGDEFDQLWLTSMIAHHQGAIEMAKAEVANGANVDAKSLADRIIDTQQAEIGQMKQMLGGS
ncbi:MAG: DUF305 domain-containing protein [Mycobacterium sp.]